MCSGHGRCVTLRELVPLGSSGGEVLGSGAPATLTLSCSLASGNLYFTLSYAASQPVPWSATLAEFALALENMATVAHVAVEALPRLLPSGRYESPARICGGGGAGSEPVVLQVTFVDAAGPVPALTLALGQLDASETGGAFVTPGAPGSLPSYGADPAAAPTWDADMLSACHCDGYPFWNGTSSDPAVADRGSWYGPSCALRSCATGMDPQSCAGAAPALEVQTLTCTATSGSFTLTFRGRTTAPLDFDASGAEVAGALQALPSVGLVAVSQPGAADGSSGGACGAEPRTTSITFLTELGDLPPLRVGALQLQGGASVAEAARGTGVVVECAGRGVCDTGAGLCVCLPNYASSNGLRLPGRRGDCGSPVRAV